MRFLKNQGPGFYVELGAHHPIHASNTYLFYLNGWSGICIDAMPGSMSNFKKCRPRDICLEVALGEENKISNFYIFNETEMNTFSEERAHAIVESGKFRLIKTVSIPQKNINSVLTEQNVTRTIDFLSIDKKDMPLSLQRWPVCPIQYKNYNRGVLYCN